MGFEGLCRWVEWDKVALGVFFPSGWDLMDCVLCAVRHGHSGLGEGTSETSMKVPLVETLKLPGH